MGRPRQIRTVLGTSLLCLAVGCDGGEPAPAATPTPKTAKADAPPVDAPPAESPPPEVEAGKPDEPPAKLKEPDEAPAEAGIAKIAERAADQAAEKASASPAEQLMADAVAAAGGRAALDAIESFHSRSTLEIEGQRISGTVELWWKGGDYYAENTMTGIGKTRAWKKGAVMWAEDPISGKRKLEGAEAKQSAWTGSLSVVGSWKEHFSEAELGPTRTVDGVEVVEVKLSGNDLEATLSLDTKTQLPRQMAFQQTTPMGDVPVTMHFEDYREVEGVKIPFRTRTSMTLAEAVQTVESLEINVEVDESRFSAE
ncbi:MAG: hypothetical protein AAF721_30145 [Myxococcota bacterium]